MAKAGQRTAKTRADAEVIADKLDAAEPPKPPEDPTDRRRRPKPLSPLAQYHRGKEIAAMRAREKPVAWAEIAKAMGMSKSRCATLYDRFMEWEQPLHDPMVVVDETIDALTVAMHEAFETYEKAVAGSSVAVRALQVAAQTALHRLALMRAAGRAPRELAAPQVAAQVTVMFRQFLDILQRHGATDEMLKEFEAVGREGIGRMTAIEGRATLAA